MDNLDYIKINSIIDFGVFHFPPRYLDADYIILEEGYQMQDTFLSLGARGQTSLRTTECHSQISIRDVCSSCSFMSKLPGVCLQGKALSTSQPALPNAAVLNMWVVTPWGVTDQMSCISDTYTANHNNSKIRVMVGNPTWGTVLRGRSTKKVKKHCPNISALKSFSFNAKKKSCNILILWGTVG